MAEGQRRVIIFLCFIAASRLFAQTPTPQNYVPSLPRGEGVEFGSPEFQNARRAIEALTPEQRKRFQENFVRWMNLSPDEKKILREREDFRRQRVAEEVDRALKTSGLNLDPARRELFAKRYAEERRKIEEQLHKDLEEKRRPLVQALVARLKDEFSTGSTTTTPAVAPP